jgi:hypothetical protein
MTAYRAKERKNILKYLLHRFGASRKAVDYVAPIMCNKPDTRKN